MADGRHVLLVDDSEAVLGAVGDSLRASGYLVTTASTGGDAIARLADPPAPDLLILDLGLPGLDGHAVIKMLGPTAPPILVITGHAMEPEDFKGGKVKRVLRKPFTNTELIDAVTGLLGGPCGDVT